MNLNHKKTGGYARPRREAAAKPITNILKSRILGRPFDPVAYAAVLEVLG